MTGSAKDDMTQEGKTFEMQRRRRDGKCQPRVFLCYVNAYSVCEIQLQVRLPCRQPAQEADHLTPTPVVVWTGSCPLVLLGFSLLAACQVFYLLLLFAGRGKAMEFVPVCASSLSPRWKSFSSFLSLSTGYKGTDPTSPLREPDSSNVIVVRVSLHISAFSWLVNMFTEHFQCTRLRNNDTNVRRRELRDILHMIDNQSQRKNEQLADETNIFFTGTSKICQYPKSYQPTYTLYLFIFVKTCHVNCFLQMINKNSTQVSFSL